jgi:hypothetical protein
LLTLIAALLRPPHAAADLAQPSIKRFHDSCLREMQQGRSNLLFNKHKRHPAH